MYYYTIKSCTKFGVRDYCNIHSNKKINTKDEIIKAIKANGGIAGFMIELHAKDAYNLYAVRISFIKYHLYKFVDWLRDVVDSIG